MKRVVKWSGLYHDQRCFRKIDRITTWRYFIFTPDEFDTSNITSSGGGRPTKCMVKADSDGSWQPLFSTSQSNPPHGILKCHPELLRTPPLKITSPDGLIDVNKCLWSEEERVNNVDKMVELHDLRDFVFQTRTDKFHWNLSQTIETEH